MKKVLLASIASAFALTLASCDNGALKKENEDLKNENTSLKEENEALKEENEELKQNNKYTIKYVNFLGKEKSLTFDAKDANILNDLKSFTDVNESNGYIKGINNSFADSNWGIMIYENGEMASTGVSGLVVDAGDVFEFKHECWNSYITGYGPLDETDVWVDKVVYNYALNRLPNTLSSLTTWNSSNYWDEMVLYHMMNANVFGTPIYDSNVFNTNMLNNDLIVATATTDVDDVFTSTDRTEILKYYYAARLLNISISNYSSNLQNYDNNLTSYNQYDEYFIPFVEGISCTLDLELPNALINTEYVPSLEYGEDGRAWFYTGQAAYLVLDEDDLDFANPGDSWTPVISKSAMLFAYAAAGVKNKELLTYIKDNYFDMDSFKFDLELTDSDYSSNQIYAALIAYKINRDTGFSFNFFS